MRLLHIAEWPQELSTSSETTSTMTAPPPFLLLFKIEYVRIINISAVKTLGIHTGFRCSWEGLKAMVSGFRKPGPRCQLCPSGWSSSFFGAGSSFGLLSCKMDIILYPSLLMLRIKNASANRLMRLTAPSENYDEQQNSPEQPQRILDISLLPWIKTTPTQEQCPM